MKRYLNIVAIGIVAGASAAIAGNAGESAQVAKGREIYAEFCQVCHGADGKRGAGFQIPIWGDGTQIAKFGNVQGLIDYMQIMPFNGPDLIDEEQKLAVIAYMLVNHGTIRPDAEISPESAGSTEIK